MSHSAMANTCYKEGKSCSACAAYAHGRGTARSYSANANTCYEKGVRYNDPRHEESRKRKIESTTLEAPRKNYMEWSAAESKSIRENGPHRQCPCTTQHGYALAKAATEVKSITPNVSNKGKKIQ